MGPLLVIGPTRSNKDRNPNALQNNVKPLRMAENIKAAHFTPPDGTLYLYSGPARPLNQSMDSCAAVIGAALRTKKMSPFQQRREGRERTGADASEAEPAARTEPSRISCKMVFAFFPQSGKMTAFPPPWGLR
jgi:hypothetical protein